jgi:hypothetical protein
MSNSLLKQNNYSLLNNLIVRSPRDRSKDTETIRQRYHSFTLANSHLIVFIIMGRIVPMYEDPDSVKN